MLQACRRPPRSVQPASIAPPHGCTRPAAQVLGKAEWLNPGGSVKDRAALGLITAAEKSGALTPGGTVVEGERA